VQECNCPTEAADYGDPAVGTLNAVIGFGFSVVGGYVAARMAGLTSG